MIIIIIQLISIFYLLKKYIKDEKQYRRIKNIFILGLCFQMLLLFIYRFNLYWIGREVYFSDAETYWEATKTLLAGGPTDAYNRTYYMMCYYIQVFSPFVWVGWNNLFNIFCIDLCVVFITIIMFQNQKVKQIPYFLYFTLFNPLIYYSLMRNLKDALFIFLVFILGYFLQKVICSKKHIGLFVLLTILSTWFFFNIRPWAFVIPVLALLVLVVSLYEDWKKYKSILFIGILLLAGIGFTLFGDTILLNLKLWTPIVVNSFLSRGIVATILGVGKFFIGPGFYRSLFGTEFFEHYTVTGNVMTAVGTLIWCFLLSLLICMIKKPVKNIKKSPAMTKFLILFFLCFLGIYVMQYGGSTEIRMRGVLYLTVFSLFFTTFDFKMTKKNVLIAMLLFMILFLISIVLG